MANDPTNWCPMSDSYQPLYKTLSHDHFFGYPPQIGFLLRYYGDTFFNRTRCLRAKFSVMAYHDDHVLGKKHLIFVHLKRPQFAPSISDHLDIRRSPACSIPRCQGKKRASHLGEKDVFQLKEISENMLNSSSSFSCSKIKGMVFSHLLTSARICNMIAPCHLFYKIVPRGSRGST